MTERAESVPGQWIATGCQINIYVTSPYIQYGSCRASFRNSRLPHSAQESADVVRFPSAAWVRLTNALFCENSVCPFAPYSFYWDKEPCMGGVKILVWCRVVSYGANEGTQWRQHQHQPEVYLPYLSCGIALYTVDDPSSNGYLKPLLRSGR